MAKKQQKWTHNQLCQKGLNWLKRSHSAGGPGCPNAFSEVLSGSNGGCEIPDVIGLKTSDGMVTIVIEVKTSVADYRADAKKPHRIDPGRGMGNYRYYMAPAGLINVNSLPAKWGLIEVGERGKLNVIAGHIIDPDGDYYFECNRDAELGMCSLLLANISSANKVISERKRLLRDKAELIKSRDTYRSQSIELSKQNHQLYIELKRHIGDRANNFINW